LIPQLNQGVEIEIEGAILEFRSGAGGEEAYLFALELA